MSRSSAFARLLVLVVTLLVPLRLSAQQETGRLVGRVVEAEAGAPLAGAQVEVVGTGIKVATAVDGRFILSNVPVGTVSLSVRLIGFQPKTVTGLVIARGETTEQNVALSGSVVQIEELAVTAEAERGTVNAALEEQRNATAIVNSMTAEQIAKSPDSDASQAVQRVSGVTVQDGKFVFVRGLDERYTTASMNGARILWNSLSGTRPLKISASVPRLIAPWSARTRTAPSISGPSVSWRISARPGATYHSARAVSRSPATPSPCIGLCAPLPAISCTRRDDMEMVQRAAATGPEI